MLTMKAKGIFLFCSLLLFLPFQGIANTFIFDDNALLDERAVIKMEEIGQELSQKTGVNVYLIVKKEAQGKDIITFEKEFSRDFKTPFVLLTLFSEDKKLDIYPSKDIEKTFDKEALLSPLPWKGTIIPLLTSKKKEVGITPALFNGYAELTDQIASSYNVVLQSSIGNANKTTINVVRLAVYGFVGALLLLVLFRRIRKNG